MNNPILSIIIVSYNTSSLTVNCLRSILRDKGLKNIPFEIIVVDNNSPDDSVEKIKQLVNSLKIATIRKSPCGINFKLKTNPNNVGFGVANNQAIKLAQGNYILLLNSDTIILHSAISQALDWLSSHPESYGCTAQLLNSDGTIQASGGYFPNIFNVKTWCLGLDDLPLVNHFIMPLHPHTPNFYTKDRYYLTDHQQDWITGAFMLLRKNVLDAVNGFDPNYFMYSEELEMCYRIKKQFPNKQLWYLIGPQITHLGGASSTNKQSIYDREYQGILSFFKKHRSLIEYQIVKYLIKVNRLLRVTIYPLFKHV